MPAMYISWSSLGSDIVIGLETDDLLPPLSQDIGLAMEREGRRELFR